MVLMLTWPVCRDWESLIAVCGVFKLGALILEKTEHLHQLQEKMRRG